jgi:hypothetical protein
MAGKRAVPGVTRLRWSAGTTQIVHVPSGQRRILVKIDFTSSNELALTPQPGDVVDLNCTGKGSPIAFFNTIVRRKAFLNLHVMTQGERAAWEAGQPQVPKPRNLGSGGEGDS